MPNVQEEARRANSQYYNLAKELGLCDREYYQGHPTGNFEKKT